MKKLLALLLVGMMIFSLAACGDNNTTDPDKDNPGTSQSGNQGGTENQGGEENNGGSTGKLPEGLKAYIGQYPFLENLVFPDDANVTEFDDSDYSGDKMVSITIGSIYYNDLETYLDKINATKEDGYEFAAVLNSDGDPLMVIDFSSIKEGRIRIDAYDYGTASGSATLSTATIDGYDIPDVALKYVGTFEKAYDDTDKVFYIKATDVTEGSFDALVDHYAANGGTLDTEYSTSSEKLFTFSWGKVIATRLGSKLSIEITLN